MDAEVFVHAIYPDKQTAQKAVQALVDAAFPSNKLAALVRKGGRPQELRVRHKTGVGVGSVLGALIGCIVGAWLFKGPWQTALEGAIAGGAVGALLGTLGGLGLWREAIDFPPDAFDGAGSGACIGVTTNETRVETARAALLEAGASEALVSSKQDAFKAANTSSAHLTPKPTNA